MDRISKKFQYLKQAGKKAFIAFIAAGDPDLETTVQLVPALEKAGADIIELGIPFSDPLADGPTIQAAFERALKKGVTVSKILHAVLRIREVSQVPIALMTSYNPVFHYGEEKFVQDAKTAGVDGIIVPDLPPEEAGNLIALCRKAEMATVFFFSPTTSQGRIGRIVKASSGFIYYVSLTGVTGARRGLPEDLEKNIRKFKKYTDQPICVGFGISTPEQVKTVSKIADGVIVGSAIVKEIEKHRDSAAIVPLVAEFVKQFIM